MDLSGALEALQSTDVSKASRETEISKAITQGDKSKLLDIFDKADEHFEESKSYRWASKSTQCRQDLHLQEYRLWMSLYLINKKGNKAVIEIENGNININDPHLFSSNLEFMSEMLRK